MTFFIASKPAILIKASLNKGKLVAVNLLPHTTFSLELQGDVSQEISGALLDWLSSYSLKKPKSLLDLDLSDQSPFTQRILKGLLTIPLGKTLSYKELAERQGYPKAYRAAGSACGRNPYPLLIPCHRIISSSGKLGGFAYGSLVKKTLLEFEKSCINS